MISTEQSKGTLAVDALPPLPPNITSNSQFDALLLQMKGSHSIIALTLYFHFCSKITNAHVHYLFLQ